MHALTICDILVMNPVSKKGIETILIKPCRPQIKTSPTKQEGKAFICGRHGFILGSTKVSNVNYKVSLILLHCELPQS